MVPDPENVAPHVTSADPVVRAAVLYVLSSRRVGSPDTFREAVTDRDHRVRIEAVRALVSVDDTAGVAAAAGDDNREVRIAAANGLATLRAGADAVRALAADPDPLVRAAALRAFAAVGCDEDDVARVRKALAESAWQVREGAARALGGAEPSAAVPSLTEALGDQHLDVRKAAVLSLSRFVSSEPAARDALAHALGDGDADVRAYARQALAG